MNHLHIIGIFLRNLYLLKRSFPRLFGMFFWTTIELFLWGFVTFWLRDIAGASTQIDFVLILLTALIFWDIFIRAMHSISFSFLEEIWARNIINLFASPMKPKEFIVGLAFLGVVQGTFAFIYATVLALLLYSLNIWQLGLYIVPFFVNILIFGWALGLVSVGLLIRFGPSVEMLTFAIPFGFLPFSAVYYPASAFPPMVQQFASFLPTMHLFEGMRAILIEGTFSLHHLIWAISLNVVYFALGILFFSWMLKIARKRGLIARLMTD